MKVKRWFAGLFLGLPLYSAVLPLAAQNAPTDMAAAFGARQDVSSLQISPDGKTVSFESPQKGQGSVVFTLSLAPGAKPRPIMVLDGKPFRGDGCHWVANDRLVCAVYGLVPDPMGRNGLLPVNRMVAINADGSNLKALSNEVNQYSRGYMLGGGSIIDWLPDQDGAVLMSRHYLPDTHTGSHLGSDAEGLGVDLLDTRTLELKHLDAARKDTVGYLSDGRGAVRIRTSRETDIHEDDTGTLTYLYRLQGATAWLPLSTYNTTEHTGFAPVAVDHDRNVAYGYKQLDGRSALYTLSLDAAPHEALVYASKEVDLGSLIRIGRRNRVIGVRYTTDVPHSEFFDDGMKQMIEALHRALPQEPLLSVVDSSVDETKMVVFAGSDADPGSYYLFDRTSHQIRPFISARPQLEGIKLAHQKPITYPGPDGVPIPAYLTLPLGSETAQGLPAIVMPHGGPSARDSWGFNWFAQFFAARGYAVLQPNYRGSAGYGDEWFQHNGFKSWDVAIGDVVAAGHWLVSQGIADPARLGIVGASYGGYAALQSTAVDPNLFKAIVAIAPVTDLDALKEERRHWSDEALVSAMVGEGAHMRDGSPINHVAEFKAPVLMFHGTMDRNVSIEESNRMAAALKAAHKSVDLITYPDRDHQLEDSEVRADVLRRSDAFLRHAFGMTP